jgi:diguanylate cyclase
MFKEISTNMLVAVAFIFIFERTFRNSNLKQSDMRIDWLYGLVGACFTVCASFFSVDVSGMNFDYSYLGIIIIGIYTGNIASLMVTCFLTIFRYFYDPLQYFTSYAVAYFLIALFNIAFKQIFSQRGQVWFFNVLFAQIAMSLVFMCQYSFHHVEEVLIFLVIFNSLMSILTIVAYFVCESEFKMNSFYRVLKVEARTDFLTGLHNAREFHKEFTKQLAITKEKHEKLSFLFIDVDHFKAINDSYGHMTGDRILKELSHILGMTCRSVDMVFRHGGEEFTVLLPNCSYEAAYQVSERVRETIEQHAFSTYTEEMINVTVSIGISTYPETVKDAKDLIIEADLALYKSKQLGRNRVTGNLDLK